MLGCCLLVSACVCVGCGRQSATHFGVEIVGQEKFIQQVTKAMSLIQENAPDDLELIAKYLRRIEEHDHSGMDASREAPTCQLAPASAYASVTWCAGCIAHEAYHSKLSQSPDYAYGLEQEEEECMAYQLTVLQKIGAPRSELEHLAAQDGKHFDLDGDGEYTWSDYEKRRW